MRSGAGMVFGENPEQGPALPPVEWERRGVPEGSERARLHETPAPEDRATRAERGSPNGGCVPVCLGPNLSSQGASDSSAPDAEPAHPLPSELSRRGAEAESLEESVPRVESSEAPYPEAPLASRRADFKPPPRWIDPEVLRAFHSGDQFCICCGHYRVSAHHLVPKGSPHFGDDALDNLIPLCHADHMALHDGHTHHAYGVAHTPERVRNRIGQFLMSEAGSDHLHYVKRKLGTGAGVWLERYGVEL